METDEEHEGHSHAKKKRIKGLWSVQVLQQQDAQDDMYYMWLYEGPQWKQRAYAIGALVLVMTFIMFPLWPLTLRIGAWYLSMAFFGLIVLFFVMAIFRLILFAITMFSHPPGLWLFPNLFEDVGFVESFIPVWAWQEVRLQFLAAIIVTHLLTIRRTKNPFERQNVLKRRRRLLLKGQR
jgi:translocation protein SEC62